MDYNEARERRKSRRLYMDARKLKSICTTSNTQNFDAGQAFNITPNINRKHKLKRKISNVSPIPMNDLTSNEVSDDEQIIENIFEGISKGSCHILLY
ncbi:hypothetical protein R6Q59_006890 [Mikania micrantha]